MDKVYFCDKCDKIVPEKDTRSFADKLYHYFDVMENAYKNQAPGTIGYCPVSRNILCAIVREPTDQEYFIHQICKT